MSTLNRIGLRAAVFAVAITLVACGGDDPALQSITVTPSAPSIPDGLPQQFTAIGSFSDGSVADLTRSVRWTSADPEVAVVDATTGLAESVGVGSTLISAASGSVSGSTTLSVTPAALQSLAIIPSQVYAGIGISTQLAATGTYTDGTTADLTASVAWTSPSAAVTLGPRPGQVSGSALASTTIEAALGLVTVRAPLAIVAAAWTPAPSPNGGNFASKAVLLLDGNVFVTSGRSVAVYDPAANKWSTAASMLTDHGAGYSATRLADGRVLVAGGTVSAAEIFDPRTNEWSAAATPLTARREHTATRLPDGQVLLAGGKDLTGQTGATLASAEKYDPVSDRWTPAGSMATPRESHTATLLVDGRVLVAGGSRATLADLRATSADLYEPTTNTWSPAARMNADRKQHSATLLGDGRVLVVGGWRPTWNTLERFLQDDWGAPAELYDPSSNTWSLTSVSGARFRHSATLLTDGRVLVAGGAAWYYYQGGPDLAQKSLRSAVTYDPATGASTPTADMPYESLAHAAVQLPGGKTLAIGGHGLETRLVFRDPGHPRLITTELPVPLPAFYW